MYTYLVEWTGYDWIDGGEVTISTDKDPYEAAREVLEKRGMEPIGWWLTDFGWAFTPSHPWVKWGMVAPRNDAALELLINDLLEAGDEEAARKLREKGMPEVPLYKPLPLP